MNVQEVKAAVSPFVSQMFGQYEVRIGGTATRPIFIAADVCAVLEIANPRHAIDSLDSDEKGVVNSDTLGGPQKMNYVTESGLYHLIFKSRKAAAKKFRRWVTEEVLPAIRRGGSYSSSAPTVTPSMQNGLLIVDRVALFPTLTLREHTGKIPVNGCRFAVILDGERLLSTHSTIESAVQEGQRAVLGKKCRIVTILEAVIEGEVKGVEWNTSDSAMREIFRMNCGKWHDLSPHTVRGGGK